MQRLKKFFFVALALTLSGAVASAQAGCSSYNVLYDAQGNSVCCGAGAFCVICPPNPGGD